MSSERAKGDKAVDNGDGHWSGVGKGENFTVIFKNTDTVGSNTIMPLGKVCLCVYIYVFVRDSVCVYVCVDLSPVALMCFGNNIFANAFKKSMTIQQTSHPNTRQCQCTHMNTITSKVSLRILCNPSLQFAPRKTQIRLMIVITIN